MAECVIADKLTIHCGGLGGVLYILVVMSYACMPLQIILKQSRPVILLFRVRFCSNRMMKGSITGKFRV